MRLSVDGKAVAKWRICTACAGLKMVALFGSGPTGVPLTAMRSRTAGR